MITKTKLQYTTTTKTQELTREREHIEKALQVMDNMYPRIDWIELEKAIRVTIRNLDNVIDVNFYTTEESRKSNQKHRPVGMGVMGWQDMLHQLGVDMESEEAVDLSDKLFEFISYIALDESSNLAIIKHPYKVFEGSKWDRGLFPLDNIQKHADDRGVVMNNDFTFTLDWSFLKQKIKQTGLRNSQVMAIAPTRSISYVAGTSPSIEPWDSNLFTEVGMTGKYQMINSRLVDELENLNLWTPEIIEQIKLNEGSVQTITEIPEYIRVRYKTAWEVHPRAIISQNARRQKWVDMGISFNMWLPNNNGKDAERLYKEAWKAGLKTTYYLHSKSKSQGEKIGLSQASNTNLNNLGASSMMTSSSVDSFSANSNFENIQSVVEVKAGQVCDMTDPECEACQ